jgi:DNA-3-methyladenine glycosylase
VSGARLQRGFYSRPTLTVARDLLGCLLFHDSPDGITSGIIVETEAYLGHGDEASHARFGRTERASTMFGRPGRAYVYFIYGLHYMFNVVTEAEHTAGAVLVRACEPADGLELMSRRREGGAHLTDGPARLCQAMGITIDQNGVDLTRGPLGIRNRKSYHEEEVMVTPRIGVGGSHEAPYRFIVRGNPHVSR